MGMESLLLLEGNRKIPNRSLLQSALAGDWSTASGETKVCTSGDLISTSNRAFGINPSQAGFQDQPGQQRDARAASVITAEFDEG